jgi:hypothetical protein
MLYNLTRETVLAERTTLASNFFKRLRGLMFSRSFPRTFEALVISPCNAVHTMFMFYPIDVVFVNDKLQVIHFCRELRPGRFSPVVKGSRQVVELPAGTVSHTGTQVGDYLSFNPKNGKEMI